ncbi:phenylacetic acid degradation operon negative regulatory protein PaaX [Massilia atriviolacea]|uniref:Phenylacetic acid degradation operon negative regulatory protein PaaX n=1 Tax=Massilia atriviolacea TaxID=2495579 RepID=A0A430HGR7_9BURK|nr:phenylacetic acid degradation operon negative regulatory protein PaaX [Massilia atriviolacea]RSZ56715.1 phenylacetic acid degradation operon negative regulatory protein PaaX [Massilia atriviolacea]
MKQLTSTAWIADFLASDPPRSKSLVMTIFGDAIAPHGGAIWLGSLIDLLAPFGVNDRLLRTSVFRLAQEGWLVANRDGRRSSYAILPQALPRFERANRRIYAPLAAHWDGNWTLVLSGAGGIDAPGRALLRKEMLWEGYAMIAPGMFGHPAGDAAVLEELLARVGVKDKLFVCRASALPGVSGRPLQDLVHEGWDLSGVIAGYRHFIERFAPLLALLDAGAGADAAPAPQQAFVIRTLLVHAYRRVQLHDPMLPIELLPDPWPGSSAYELARAVYARTYAGAETHIMDTLKREDERTPRLDAGFFQRFGGLAGQAPGNVKPAVR